MSSKKSILMKLMTKPTLIGALVLALSSPAAFASPSLQEMVGTFPTPCGLWVFENDERLLAVSYIDPDSAKNLVAISTKPGVNRLLSLSGLVLVNGRPAESAGLKKADRWSVRFTEGKSSVELSGTVQKVCTALDVGDESCDGLVNKSAGQLKLKNQDQVVEIRPVVIYNGCQSD